MTTTQGQYQPGDVLWPFLQVAAWEQNAVSRGALTDPDALETVLLAQWDETDLVAVLVL